MPGDNAGEEPDNRCATLPGARLSRCGTPTESSKGSEIKCPSPDTKTLS